MAKTAKFERFYMLPIGCVDDVITKEQCEAWVKEHDADAIWAFTLDRETFRVFACYRKPKDGTKPFPMFLPILKAGKSNAYYAKDIVPDEEDVLYYKGVLYKLTSEFAEGGDM